MILDNNNYNFYSQLLKIKYSIKAKFPSSLRIHSNISKVFFIPSY